MNSPADTDIAYAAGMIDGEGCITIVRQKGKYKFQYRLMVVVSNNNEEVTRHLQKIFDCGAVHPMRRISPIRSAWQWQISGADAYNVILAIQSRLIVKRQDAAIAIEFFNLPPNDYAREIDPRVEAERERLFFLISEGRYHDKKRKKYEKLS